MRRVRYDAQARALDIELGDQSIQVKGLGDALFHRHGHRNVDTDSTELALWVTATEAGVLVKMAEYILAKVKITEASRAALESILPHARELAEVPADRAPDPSPETETAAAESSAV